MDKLPLSQAKDAMEIFYEIFPEQKGQTIVTTTTNQNQTNENIPNHKSDQFCEICSLNFDGKIAYYTHMLFVHKIVTQSSDKGFFFT